MSNAKDYSLPTIEDVKLLQKLLHLHPRWKAMEERLTKGAKFPIQEIDEDTHKKDLHMATVRGNHKSATEHEKFLADAAVKEIKKGWNLIIHEESASEIPNLEIAPLGVADALGVSASGEFISKLRITHDLSFPGAISGESVNSRVIKEELEPCMFGHALLRIIHYIVHLRKKYPQKKIWLQKEDFKSAYRRLHLNAETAIKSAV
jgi:hypothetical protein